MPIFVGAIADDDTGATDLAGMLTEQGMRTAVVLDHASMADLQLWSSDCDALIIGTAARALAPSESYRRTAEATSKLLQLGAKRIAVKYCSTFDSTQEGNIGPSID